jgi:hypothetical protein
VAKLQTFRLPRVEKSSGEWKVLFLITVAGPCRTYTGFPFMPLQAPRKLLSQVVQSKTLDVNGIKTFLTQIRLALGHVFSVGGKKLLTKGTLRRALKVLPPDGFTCCEKPLFCIRARL